jgi:asparagine synthase (glutamine-hydrolysing)
MAVATALGSSNESVALWGLRAADLHGYLPDDVLTKVDRSTMAVSLESRTPFLSADIAEYAMHLQSGDLIANGRGKQPLRRLLARLLPDADFTQPKTGFGVPIASLLRNELLDLLDSSIAEFRRQAPPADLAGIHWEGLRDQLVAGDDGAAPQLWTLVAFELWVSRLSGFPGWEVADPQSGTSLPAI